MSPTWVAKSASWYMNDPFKNAEFGIWMGWFFKIFPNFSQIWLKLKKIFLEPMWPWLISIFLSHAGTTTTVWFMAGIQSVSAPKSGRIIWVFTGWRTKTNNHFTMSLLKMAPTDMLLKVCIQQKKVDNFWRSLPEMFELKIKGDLDNLRSGTYHGRWYRDVPWSWPPFFRPVGAP